MDRSSARASLLAMAQLQGNKVFDRVARIETAGSVSESELGFGSDRGEAYVPSNWINLIGFLRMTRTLGIGDGDVFLDLGCGKGQVLFLAARLPFERIIGLDVSEQMVAIARRNLDPSKHRFKAKQIELVTSDAVDYKIPADVNICYLYNPFPRPIMEEVMANLEASLAAHPRRMRILYLEAVYSDLLEEHGFREERRIRRLRLYGRDPVDERGT